MTVLENLYNGNIEPTDSESLKNNMRYKEGLRLVGRLPEELSATLNAEQKELFEKYLTAANELSVVINEETFKRISLFSQDKWIFVTLLSLLVCYNTKKCKFSKNSVSLFTFCLLCNIIKLIIYSGLTGIMKRAKISSIYLSIKA